MNKYVFILGRNPELSIAEIKAVLLSSKLVKQTSTFLILENKDFDCQQLLNQLGGTIKIGEILSDKIDKAIIVENLLKQKSGGKLNFGLSYYDSKKDQLGMAVKRQLKDKGVSSRLVTSKDKTLSSVVVSKNKCHEFLILNNEWLAKTCGVQDFEEYSKRDYGRPVRDTKSGTLPPKLAKIMINLAQVSKASIILDPFCGSGTILQEALVMGYKNIIGSDISQKAIDDTNSNLEWLTKSYQLKAKSYKIVQSDVRNLSQKVKTVDAIVTEPYLGPALKGGESKKEIEKIIKELEELYLSAFEEFTKVLKSGGKVVIIFPWFKKYNLSIEILSAIKKLGFSQLNKEELVYSRPDQKVWRKVFVFKKL